jgi:hypothetical protein
MCRRRERRNSIHPSSVFRIRQPCSPGICCRDLLPTRRPVAATSEEAG